MKIYSRPKLPPVRFITTLGIVLTLSLGITGVVSAHELKVDGEITAVLHTNPDDNPKTGAPTEYILAFNDETGRFNLSDCGCKVSIRENGQTIATQTLHATTSTESDNHFTFPKPATYDLHITGTPKQPNAFQPFTFDYDVTVANGETHQAIPVLLWVSVGVGIGLIVLLAYVTNRKASSVKQEKA